MLLTISLNLYVLSTTKQLVHAALAFITVTWVRVCVGKSQLIVGNKLRVLLILNTNITTFDERQISAYCITT